MMSGIVLALLGWNLSSLILYGAGESLEASIIPWPNNFHEDFILLPIIAASLAVAMVVIEIFISNPTRYKTNRRILPQYLTVAGGAGLLAGLLASILTLILNITGFPGWVVRIISWSLIGVFTGLAEGTIWRLRSIEGGTKRAIQRIRKATLFGLLAGLTAAISIEILNLIPSLERYSEPLGFLILGLSLGAFLSFVTSSAHQFALRAGAGFEAVYPSLQFSKQAEEPKINPLNCSTLRFVTKDHEQLMDKGFSQEEALSIEEGLSIQIPSKFEKLMIGSDEEADIYLPKIPSKAASLQVKNHEILLNCLAENTVQVQSRILNRGSKPVTLRHNQILTFFWEYNEENYYRFVFYNRFLDPEA